MANLFRSLRESFRKKFLGLPDLAKPPNFEEGADDGFLSFMLGEEQFRTASTNVYSFQWNSGTEELTVGYCGWKGHRDESKLRYYVYEPIAEWLARQFYQAESAGEKVWRELRIKGTVCGHHVSYRFIAERSLYHPKNPC